MGKTPVSPLSINITFLKERHNKYTLVLYYHGKLLMVRAICDLSGVTITSSLEQYLNMCWKGLWLFRVC